MDFDKLIPCRVFNLIHRFLKHFPLLKRIKTISFYLHVNLNLPGECHNLRLRVVQCMLRKTDEFRSKVLLIDYCKKDNQINTKRTWKLNFCVPILFRYIFKLKEVSKPILQSRKLWNVFQYIGSGWSLCSFN